MDADDDVPRKKRRGGDFTDYEREQIRERRGGDFTDKERERIREMLLAREENLMARKIADRNWLRLGNILKWAGVSGAAIVALKFMIVDAGNVLRALLSWLGFVFK